jgi:TPR repeat protein
MVRHYAPAESNLGFMYLQGRGVPANTKEAAKLFRKAARTGDATAQYNLGLLYYLGSGVKQDSGVAAKLFRAAAAGGSREAQSGIGSSFRSVADAALVAAPID